MKIDTSEIRDACESMRHGYPNTGAVIQLLTAHVAPALPELTMQEVDFLLNALNGTHLPVGTQELKPLPQYLAEEVYTLLASSLDEDQLSGFGKIKEPGKWPEVAFANKLRALEPEQALALFVAAELFFALRNATGEKTDIAAFFKITV